MSWKKYSWFRGALFGYNTGCMVSQVQHIMPDDFHQLLTLPSAKHCSQPANEGMRLHIYKELLLDSSWEDSGTTDHSVISPLLMVGLCSGMGTSAHLAARSNWQSLPSTVYHQLASSSPTRRVSTAGWLQAVHVLGLFQKGTWRHCFRLWSSSCTMASLGGYFF